MATKYTLAGDAIRVHTAARKITREWGDNLEDNLGQREKEEEQKVSPYKDLFKKKTSQMENIKQSS